MGIDIGLDIQRLYSLGLLNRLLKDKTTGHNILWATDAYSALGMRYGYDEPLSPELITGANAGVIQARAQKGQARRDKRTRQRGEVCTPLWVVKKMVDYADEVWFGTPDRFFRGDTPTPRVRFDRENDWQRYVDSRRLEITCGEAPYLVTRYDVETGEPIPLARRIGILDRKLRVVGENTDNETDWLHWAMRAFEACYGYELQGDSLLTARVNLLMTLADYYSARWNKPPAPKLYGQFLNRIVWNIWQMDGLTGALPCPEESDPRLSLAEFAEAGGAASAAPLPMPPHCRIYDWRSKRNLEYLAMQQKGARAMRFDYVLGNPPYQEEAPGTSTSDKPIYHLFMDESYKTGDKIELITPARFLFNAGATPSAWNKRMLSDEHLKVLDYQIESNKVFPNTLIVGGVAITLYDHSKCFGSIETFTAYPELRSILRKIIPFIKQAGSLDSIIYTQSKFNLAELNNRIPTLNRTDKRLESNIFQLSIFTEAPMQKDDLKIIGLVGNKREFRYVNRKFIDMKESKNITRYKILLSKSNGASGVLGNDAARLITRPFIGEPLLGYTRTFIGIGAFETQYEANAALKYVLGKFSRIMLGVLKVTQDNNPDKWRYVPLQDFTPASDIDWSQPIPAIDRQLYAKYGLDEQEIAFIESHVKEME